MWLDYTAWCGLRHTPFTTKVVKFVYTIYYTKLESIPHLRRLKSSKFNLTGNKCKYTTRTRYISIYINCEDVNVFLFFPKKCPSPIIVLTLYARYKQFIWMYEFIIKHVTHIIEHAIKFVFLFVFLFLYLLRFFSCLECLKLKR